MRRFRIHDHTSLAYSTPVSASHKPLRMTPTTETGQTALENRIKVRPMTWNHVYQDYWGSHVTAMAVAAERQRLEIDAVRTVERTTVDGGPGGASWDDLRTESVNDAHYEWLALDAHTRLPCALTDQVRADTEGRSVPLAAEHAFGILSGHLEYQPGGLPCTPHRRRPGANEVASVRTTPTSPSPSPDSADRRVWSVGMPACPDARVSRHGGIPDPRAEGAAT